MSPHLLLKGKHLYGWCSKTSSWENELSKADVQQKFAAAPLTIVLHDPSYLSACYSVELKNPRSQKIMAWARFTELAGADGFGHWCIVPHEKKLRLYVLALDPSSVEAARLRSLKSMGMDFKALSSRSLLGVDPRSVSSLYLKVVVAKEKAQIALLLHGQWVFARRVDLSATSAVEAIESTLYYLQSQAYIDLPFQGTWHLQADELQRAEVSCLWEREAAPLIKPLELAEDPHMVFSAEPKISFSCLGTVQSGLLQTYGKSILRVTLAGSLLCLVSLLPFVLLAGVKLPEPLPTEVEPLSETLQRWHWEMQQLDTVNISKPSNVLVLLNAVLQGVKSNGGVKVQGLSFGKDKPLRLQCSLDVTIADPLLRQKFLVQLKTAIQNNSPTAQVQIVASDQFTVGDTRRSSGFEIILDGFNETR